MECVRLPNRFRLAFSGNWWELMCTYIRTVNIRNLQSLCLACSLFGDRFFSLSHFQIVFSYILLYDHQKSSVGTLSIRIWQIPDRKLQYVTTIRWKFIMFYASCDKQTVCAYHAFHAKIMRTNPHLSIQNEISVQNSFSQHAFPYHLCGR